MRKLLLFLTITIFTFSTAYADVGKREVGRKELKKNAVTGKKVKDNSLSGDDIKEVNHIPQIMLSNGQTQEIFNDGIITLRAECEINNGDGADVARVLVFSTEDGTAFDGTDEVQNLLGTTADDDRELARDLASTTGDLSIDNESDGIIMTPTGHIYVSTISTGVNLFGAAGSCFFFGTLYHVEPEAS